MDANQTTPNATALREGGDPAELMRKLKETIFAA